MTREQNIELIRSKCIESSPAIANEQIMYRIKRVDTESFSSWEERPIRLADVLLAIDNNSTFPDGFPQYAVATDGFIGKLVDMKSLPPKGAWWKLKKDDLTEQSDECLEFLTSLIH